MRAAGKSDQGKTRSSNQDSYAILWDEKGNLLTLVCDGVGGGNHGEEASRLAVDILKRKFEENEQFRDLEDAQAWFFSAINQANQLILERGNEVPQYKGMGTTLVGALFTQYGGIIANAGDSRAYALDNQNGFYPVTNDHSYVARLVESGQLTPEQAAHHPRRHVITNAVGIWNKVTIDFFPVRPEYETILLCSDGLHDYVDMNKAADIIRTNSLGLEEKCQRLIDAADDAGGFDNVTVLLIDLKGGVGHE